MLFTNESTQEKGRARMMVKKRDVAQRVRDSAEGSRDHAKNCRRHRPRQAKTCRTQFDMANPSSTARRMSNSLWRAVLKGGDSVYKEADFPLDLALRSQHSVYSELLQLRNPRLCTHHLWSHPFTQKLTFGHRHHTFCRWRTRRPLVTWRQTSETSSEQRYVPVQGQ